MINSSNNNPAMRIAEACTAPLMLNIARTNRDRAEDLLLERMTRMLADRIFEGDDKGDELNFILDNLNKLAGPIISDFMRDAAHRQITELIHS